MAIERDIVINVKEKGIDELQVKVLKLDSSLENLEDTNKNLSKTMEGTQQSVLDNGGAMGLLNDATGGLAMTVKDAVEASALFAKQSKIGMAVQKAYTAVVGSSTGAMKVFKLALIGTGIGAIVIAIGLLIANFDKVKKAVMNLIPGLSLVGDFFGKIVNAVTDFVGVTSDLTRELKRLGEEADKTIKRNTEFLELYANKYDEYTKRKIEANLNYAKKYKEFQDQEGGITTENLEYLKKLRKKYNDEILQADQDRNDASAKKRQEERDKINEENRKQRDDAYNLEAEKIANKKALEEQLAKELSDKNKEGNKILKEVLDEKEQIEIDAEDRRLQKMLENIEAEKIAEETLRNMRVSIRENTTGLLLAIAKKGGAVSKAIQIAEIIREQVASGSKSLSAMTLANAKAISASPLTGGQPFVTINTAQVLTGMALSAVGAGKAIKDILSESKNPTQFSAGGGGGGGSAPSAPSFNLVQGTGSNQIAQGLQKSNQPIKAFVVSSDVSTGQELDRKIIAGASL
jgi:hypothetical protein